jgi:hypothetical protein
MLLEILIQSNNRNLPLIWLAFPNYNTSLPCKATEPNGCEKKLPFEKKYFSVINAFSKLIKFIAKAAIPDAEDCPNQVGRYFRVNRWVFKKGGISIAPRTSEFLV